MNDDIPVVGLTSPEMMEEGQVIPAISLFRKNSADKKPLIEHPIIVRAVKAVPHLQFNRRGPFAHAWTAEEIEPLGVVNSFSETGSGDRTHLAHQLSVPLLDRGSGQQVARSSGLRLCTGTAWRYAVDQPMTLNDERPILGFRAWDLHGDHLTSPYAPQILGDEFHADWDTRTVRAECFCTPQCEEPIPMVGGHCGISSNTRPLVRLGNIDMGHGACAVQGVVALHGRVMSHDGAVKRGGPQAGKKISEGGWRAEEVEILALTKGPDLTDPDALQRCAARLGVPIVGAAFGQGTRAGDRAALVLAGIDHGQWVSRQDYVVKNWDDRTPAGPSPELLGLHVPAEAVGLADAEAHLVAVAAGDNAIAPEAVILFTHNPPSCQFGTLIGGITDPRLTQLFQNLQDLPEVAQREGVEPYSAAWLSAGMSRLVKQSGCTFFGVEPTNLRHIPTAAEDVEALRELHNNVSVMTLRKEVSGMDLSDLNGGLS